MSCPAPQQPTLPQLQTLRHLLPTDDLDAVNWLLLRDPLSLTPDQLTRSISFVINLDQGASTPETRALVLPVHHRPRCTLCALLVHTKFAPAPPFAALRAVFFHQTNTASWITPLPDGVLALTRGRFGRLGVSHYSTAVIDPAGNIHANLQANLRCAWCLHEACRCPLGFEAYRAEANELIDSRSWSDFTARGAQNFLSSTGYALRDSQSREGELSPPSTEVMTLLFKAGDPLLGRVRYDCVQLYIGSLNLQGSILPAFNVTSSLLESTTTDDPALSPSPPTKSARVDHEVPAGDGDKPKKMQVCPVCGRKMASAFSLERHIRVKHQDQTSSQILCSHCPATFNQRSNCLRHMQTVHGGDQAFQCDLCPAQFSRQADRTRHRRLHSGQQGRIDS